MKKRDYIYKTINGLFYAIAALLFVVLFVYINQQWDAIPEEISYTWGINQAEDIVASKWGVFILIGLMILHIKKTNKKQRKYEKKQKTVNASVRWKRFAATLKITLISFTWSMIIVYIVQHSFGKAIENGLHYIFIIMLSVLMLNFVDQVILSLLNKKNREKEVSHVKSSRKNIKKIR